MHDVSETDPTNVLNCDQKRQSELSHIAQTLWNRNRSCH